MASPDFSNYVDLTVYDMQPDEIYDAVVDYIRTAIPEWDPVGGSIEDAILQSTGTMTGYVLGAINRLPGSLLEAILKLYGIERNVGTRATGSIEVTFIDDAGYTIPAGSRLGYYQLGSENPTLYVFETDDDIVVAQGNTSAFGSITGIEFVKYPSLAIGQTLQILTNVSFVDSIELTDDLAIGQDPETDADYLARGVAKMASFSSALVTETQFEQYVLGNYTSAYRAKAYSRVNPANDAYNDALENGYLTIYASQAGGASLTPATITTIEEDLTDKAVGGLIVNVVAPNSANVTVSVTVVKKSGFDATTVEQNVEDAMNLYIHPDYWNWSDKVYYNEVVSYIDSVAGVERVSALTLGGTGHHASGSDLEFDNKGTLPTNTTTVTVS